MVDRTMGGRIVAQERACDRCGGKCDGARYVTTGVEGNIKGVWCSYGCLKGFADGVVVDPERPEAREGEGRSDVQLLDMQEEADAAVGHGDVAEDPGNIGRGHGDDEDL